MAAVESHQNERLQKIERKLEVALDGLRDRADEIQTLEAELEAKDERIDELEARVDELDGRTDLMRVIEQSDKMTGKQRSITLLQHLQRAAQKQGSDCSVNSGAKASVTREQAEIALQHPDVHRSTIYSDMERAVDLVGDTDVCWYGSNGDNETRLWLDLDAGGLPAEFNTGE